MLHPTFFPCAPRNAQSSFPLKPRGSLSEWGRPPRPGSAGTPERGGATGPASAAAAPGPPPAPPAPPLGAARSRPAAIMLSRLGALLQEAVGAVRPGRARSGRPGGEGARTALLPAPRGGEGTPGTPPTPGLEGTAAPLPVSRAAGRCALGNGAPGSGLPGPGPAEGPACQLASCSCFLRLGMRLGALALLSRAWPPRPLGALRTLALSPQAPLSLGRRPPA